MTQKQFVLSDWVAKLSDCLQETVSYEMRMESELLFLKQQGEKALGLLGNARHDTRDNVRERISQYPLFGLSEPYPKSHYRQNISQNMSTLQDVLLEHPTLKWAA